MSKLLSGFSNINKLEQALRTKPESFWVKRGDSMALNLHTKMYKSVPAYASFLKQAGIKKPVKNLNSLSALPTLSKESYLKEYSRSDLCWGGSLENASWVISTTSGSTGEPYYFPRQADQDEDYALMAELYLRANFEIQSRSTLYIVAFPMGAWIGGLFTYEALRRVAERGGYNLSIITPGINKLEVIKAVQNLGKDFDQIIIGSYAPFLKDILDDGVRAGLNWHEYNLGFVFSAEGFSEVFRDYVISKTNISDPYMRTLNHYGTVDLGTMAHETPLSILIRRLALEHNALYEDIFGQGTKLPTLAQYMPEKFYFESVNGNIICSSFSGLPLSRYDLKDHGGVISFEEMKAKFLKHGLDLDAEIEATGITNTVWKLPFVYVYERSDFSVSFFAFQIYPETIRKALQSPLMQTHVTGKFTMSVDYDQGGRQIFSIQVELAAEVAPDADLLERTTRVVMEQLLIESSEYRQTHEELAEEAVKPVITFWPYEDPTHFKIGTKQKWVKK